MDKSVLKTLSDLELVLLQYEARAANDTKLVNDILTVLGERESFQSQVRFNYMRLSETEHKYTIMMQFDGGGAMMNISKNDNSQIVADKLRYLAELIERSVSDSSLSGQG